jgi:1-acyl-sn-glycerol-3-phosphate acyltransferase
LAPGGIAEMFEGYPKQGTHPDEEYSIVRKGIFRLAVQHGVPVIPVYCFGSTKLLRRLQLPPIVEKLSLLLRTSLVLFYGQGMLPVPFRQKLMYVMGQPIHPRRPTDTSPANQAAMDKQVDDMLERYCEEMLRIFERQKESYGWAHKSLKLILR